MRKALFIVAASLLLYGGIYYMFLEATDVSVLRKQYPVVLYKGKEQDAKIVFVKRRPDSWVNLNEISRDAVKAVLISEDAAFYMHNGYDFDQILEAAKENWRKKRFARGGSTITQQVTKNVFLEADKNLWRKIRELILALRMERQVGKKRILETYFNIAEWGEGIYGIKAAAQYYFHKDPSQLTVKEGAFLAMLLPSPIRYSTSFRKGELSKYARSTIASILRKLEQVHHISPEEFVSAASTPLSFEKVISSESNPDIGTATDDEALDEEDLAPVPTIVPSAEI